MEEKIKEFIFSHKDEIVKDLAELVAIPSVLGEPEKGAPFGREPRRALSAMESICKNMGFETSVIGSAVLCADFGGEPELGVLAHLDVVPALEDNWGTDPFTLTEKNGALFGRGAIDDKGPAVAALWALNAVKSLGIPLKKGVRLIFGTDEENGFKDLEIYKESEKFPPKVFTPDGSFPVINVEKGMLGVKFKGIVGGNALEFRGGNIPNAVPDKAKAILRKATADRVNNAIVPPAEDDTDAPKFAVSERGNGVLIACSGRAAHSSTPEMGVNAVTAAVELLAKLMGEDILIGLARLFPFGETDGAALGLQCADESGALTCVLSTLAIAPGGEMEGTIDIRFPTCTSVNAVESKLRAALQGLKIECETIIGKEPHVVPEDSELVKRLLAVYERVEGEKGRCIAIGGGTYVHNIEGGVAFGAERGDTDYHMHGANEFITVDELLNDAVLFANAVIEICG
ncbi:MAG: Sapep family Mn(2+)-dependent dipeptidase [Lachnospiraceae bacterium]|nr:Sapep family Mn(2+)-dependent dipeptidase [Ruminococcus sp.]MCM1274677.1 Sapep family Mn(2+)-dependent dipeptidase [Lachnospiraceae bacterium]